MSTWACHGWRWSDRVVGSVMKGLKDCNDPIQTPDLALSPPFSCLHLVVVQSTMVEVLQSLQGNPGSRCWWSIFSCLYQCWLSSPNIYFPPQHLLLGNSVPLLFLTRSFSTGVWTQTYATPVFSNERCLRLHDAFIARIKMTVFIWKGNWSNSMDSFYKVVRAQFSMTMQFLS